MTNPDAEAAASSTRRPVVLRGGTVLTMDDAHTVLTDADVLVQGDKIAAVGPRLDVPEGALEVDARGGIVMPGMIDTHRHMWQTAMRAYGADWTLTQYFVWYYLEHGKHFRPEDIYIGNLMSAWESLESGVTTTVDWSHGLQTPDHGEAAVEALQAVPGRFVLAYGNIQAGPWEWTNDPAVRAFFARHTPSDLLAYQIAFDVTGDPAFPEKAAFEAARELGLPVTTHAGVWGATSDASIQLMHENGFMTPETTYVHSATLTTDSYQRIAASGGSISVATESEQSAGQGYPPTWQVRKHGIPVSLSMDTSVWWSGDLFSAMRTTLGADRSREHLEAHAQGETVTNAALRAEHVVHWATRGGAHAIGRDDLGLADPGGQGRRGADQERPFSDLVPAAQPLRPRRLPGPARRRAYGAGQRPGGQDRPPAGGGRPRGDQALRRRHHRAHPWHPWRRGLERRYAPRAAQHRRAGQPVPVHRVQGRLQPQRTGQPVRRAGEDELTGMAH